MLTGPGIKECILGQEDISRINTIIASGKGKRNSGPQTFDQHIFELYEKGLISKSVALEAATSESDFNQKLIVD
jgi:twitching motility protein PilT